MATTTSCGDFNQLLQPGLNQMAQSARRQQEKLAADVFQSKPGQFQMASHTHSIGGALGMADPDYGISSGTTGWATSTDALDLSVSADGYVQQVQDWDEAAKSESFQRAVRQAQQDVLPDLEPTKPKNRMVKWFRINKRFGGDYGNDQPRSMEPLDDLRIEMAEWLEDV